LPPLVVEENRRHIVWLNMRLTICFVVRSSLHHGAQSVAGKRRSASLTALQVAKFHPLAIEAVSMLIATRVLKLRRPTGDIEIPIRIFAPEQKATDWTCKFEVGWPDGTITMAAGGVDAVQALEMALRMIGAFIYASDHHTSGRLAWLEPGKGYGFPVTKGIRDLLVGDDKKFF
jgi:hypothetical protein